MISLTISGHQIGVPKRDLQRVARRIPKAINLSLKREVQILRRVIVKGIRNQAPGGEKFKPLAETTKKMKRSSKALIDTGDLIKSINVTEEAGNVFFVGVHRKERGKEGQDLVNIAEVHEFGTDPYQILVTPAMRRWWMAMFLQKLFNAPLPKWIAVINHPGVPERPFLRPSYKLWSKMAEHSFQANVEKRIKKLMQQYRRRKPLTWMK